MSEEEQDAASGGNLIEGTPGGIGGEEMRDTMMGSDDPDNEPGTSGRGFGSTGASTERRSNAGSPQPHRGLAMALQKMVEASPNTMKVELKRQSDLRDNYLDAASQKLLDEYVADPFNLRVFATMKESASTRIRLLWGLGKFVDVERTGDVPADILAFSGNVDTAGNVPAMVALPVQSTPKWPAVRGHFDDMDPYEEFYADAGNKSSLRPLPPTTGGGAGTDRVVPRLLHIPGELGVFVAARTGCTPFDLYTEAKRMANDPECTEDMTSLGLVMDWCVAASYKESGKSHSVLALKTREVSSDLPAFVDFKNKKCNHLLGTVHQQSHPQGQQQAQQPASMESDRMMQFAERLVASTAQAFASQSGNNRQGQEAGGAGASTANPLLASGGKIFPDKEEQAAVMGWSGITNSAHIPKIWREIKSTASTMTRRNAVFKGMVKWGKEKYMEINKNFLLPDQFFKDMIKCECSMDEAVPSYGLLDRGMSAQLCLPVSLEFKARERARESAEGESAATRTYSESIARQTRDPRRPPNTLEELKKAVATFAALLYVFFGPLCVLYQQVLAFREAMDMPAVEQKHMFYNAELCREYWFQVLTSSREFFFTLVTHDDFMAANPVFPTSTLGLFIQPVLNADNIRNGAFPTQWKTHQTPQAGGGGGGRGGQQGMSGGGGGYQGAYQGGQGLLPPPPGPPPQFGNNNNDQNAPQNVDHCHQIIKNEFREYHRLFQGQARLYQLCQHSNIAIKDLPWIREYIVNSRNNLCYNYLLGICRTDGCRRAHAAHNTLPNDFVMEICRVTKPGRDYLIRRGNESNSSGGTGGGTPDSVQSGAKKRRRS